MVFARVKISQYRTARVSKLARTINAGTAKEGFHFQEPWHLYALYCIFCHELPIILYAILYERIVWTEWARMAGMDLNGLKIHFMGIGGVGVSALAEMARAAGAIVSGCDRQDGALVQRLRGKGIAVAVGHDAGHVAGVDLLVYSSAVPADHPERAAAPRQEKRGRFLARFLDRAESWGVSGTHGKTTTSWLLANVLIDAGMDPSVFIGGVVDALPEGNYRIGSGPFVSELDESDASFLLPKLRGAVLTNIESDHLSHYRREDALFDAFRTFAAGVEAGGVLVAGVDNAVVNDIFTSHKGEKISFGLAETADFRGVDLRQEGRRSVFRVLRRGGELGEFTLQLPGRHNVLNALAALAAADGLGVDADVARDSLSRAKTVERRLELLGRFAGANLYTDYAHHPTEVAASLAALRQRHDGRLLAVFQPHLYSRTRDYADAFGRALALADAVLLLDVYPAREEPIPGVDSGLIAAAAGREIRHVHGPVALAEMPAAAAELARGCSTVVMMGAGDIDAVARALAEPEEE